MVGLGVEDGDEVSNPLMVESGRYRAGLPSQERAEN